MRSGTVRIGLSGWAYPQWRGHFYPKGLRQSDELAHAASCFPALEINATFYGPQRPRVFDRWAAATPEDFVFAVKAPRLITHDRRLRNIEAPLAEFFAAGLLRLGGKLGPLLWQLPPSLPFDAGRMRDFLSLLPRDTEAAAAMAGRKAAEPGLLDEPPPVRHRLRHAVEVRHDSFRDPAFIRLLREQDIALVCADTPRWPRLMDVTSDFVYCRLHGSPELYRSGYDDWQLRRWAGRIAAWSRGEPMHDGEFAGDDRAPDRPRDVFLFFDNTDGLHAPDDALALIRAVLNDVLTASGTVAGFTAFTPDPPADEAG